MNIDIDMPFLHFACLWKPFPKHTLLKSRKFRNFGKKSLTELDALVEDKNLSFGMDLEKYKLEKE